MAIQESYKENALAEPGQHDKKLTLPIRSSPRPDDRQWLRYGQHNWYSRLSKYVVVGVAGVLVNNVALFALFEKVHLPLVIASALAVELAIISNFIWNNYWTFKSTHLSLRRFAQFNLVSLGGLIISTGILWMLVNQLGLYYLAANLLAIGLATIWNFMLNSLWTWGRV